VDIRADIHDARFNEIIDLDAGLETVVTGFKFTEGPIWHPGEASLIFSDILGNSIFRWCGDAGLEMLRRNSYMANGNAYDRVGRVVTCEHATSRLVRWSPASIDVNTNEGLEVLASTYEGKQLNSPNDVIVARDGVIYFTDPTSGRSAGYGVPREPDLDHSGVYRLDPKTGALTLLVTDFAKPNGLCFSRDETRLFVNDTDRMHIRVFDVLENGQLTGGNIWAETRGVGAGVPDGMKIDSDDNIYCCGPGGVHLFDADGVALGVIRIPEQAANFAFGDADLCSLYITASTTLYRVRVLVPGHPTFPFA